MASRSALQATGARMAEVLAMQRLHDTVAQLAQTEQLQRALFAIADMAGSDLDMPDMLRGLHRIVGELMYAENFFIALYDAPSDSVRFLYFVDSVDEEGPQAGTEFPLDRIKHGPTWWMVRERKPLMGSSEQLQSQVSGPLDIHGADSSDWLGVPMLREGQVQGVIVVQSYLPDVVFSSADMALLGFVSQHILTALERKQTQEELEHRVEERTAQLAETNEELRQEVAERQRGERLQAALYQISSLAVSEETGQAFYARIHHIISGLLDAENFYIGLLSEDGSSVAFPYATDDLEPDWSSRPRSRGLTEYVLETRRTQIVDAARFAELCAEGRVDSQNVGVAAMQWVGVPLLVDERPIGVLAVQSYSDAQAYSPADAELLEFVANQLASSLQRRREIAERERGEHLQGVLYQIAALAGTDESSDRFFGHVHSAISRTAQRRQFLHRAAVRGRHDARIPVSGRPERHASRRAPAGPRPDRIHAAQRARATGRRAGRGARAGRIRGDRRQHHRFADRLLARRAADRQRRRRSAWSPCRATRPTCATTSATPNC